MGFNMWKNGLVEWTDGNTAFLSVVFSWKLHEAYQRAVWYQSTGYYVRAGGPAVTLNPTYLADVAEVGGSVPALYRHNSDATFTTRGCVNKCAFCAVPRLEGDLVELDDWPVKPVICDNNITAASIAHFDKVIDRLLDKGIKSIDFNQGLDARRLTEHHAERIAELHTHKQLHAARLAFDHSRLENEFRNAVTLFTDAGVPVNKIHVYCLIGFNDTPQDALYRLELIDMMGCVPNPMRYQPLDAVRRNSYVGEAWTNRQLSDYMRYWSRSQFFKRVGVSFKDYF